MVDFSSVNLRILSPDGKNVLAELQTIDRAGQRVARNAGASATAGLQQVQRQAAVSARQIAGGVATIAAAGETTVASLKQIVSQGANMAFMFGAGGAVAGAIGVTALAMVTLFNRTRKEIEETARKAAAELRSLAQAGDIGRMGGRFGVATQLFSGEGRFAVRGEKESAEDFLIRQRGILGGRAELARLQAVIDDKSDTSGTGRRNRALATREWEALGAALAKVEGRYGSLIGLMRELEAVESERASRVVDDLRARSSLGLGDTRTGLIGRNGLPVPGITGSPMVGTNMVELRAAMIEGIRKNLKPADIGPSLAGTEFRTQALRDWKEMANSIGLQFGRSLADSIAAGFEAAFAKGANFGTAMASFGGAFLQALGGILQQIGTQALMAAKLIAQLQATLFSNPVAAIPAAIGLIALGGVLRGVGGRMISNSPVGGGGGGGYNAVASSGVVIDRGLINPLNGSPSGVRSSVNLTAVFYGSPDEPKTQRWLLTTIDKARARREG